MIITISSKNNEKSFSKKELINIGSNNGCDFVADIGSDFILTLQCDLQNKKCVVLNNFNNQKILFKGQPMGQKIEFDNVCKLMSADNDEFISIKISEEVVQEQVYEQNAIEQKKI